MSSQPSTDWLKHSLLRLSPNVFFHHIWTDFVRTNTLFAPHLIEELNQAADQVMAGNDLKNACQLWLICAVLESRLDNHEAALALVEKTAELAQNYHLPQIDEWANWGASSLCARQGNWQQAAKYLQRLQQTLNEQGEWMLANIIALLESELAQLATREQDSPPNLTAEPQLDIVLEQLLRWEKPVLTAAPASLQLDDGRSSPWHSFWQTVTGFFRGKPRSQPEESPAAVTTDVLPVTVEEMRPDTPGLAASKDPPLTIYMMGPFRVFCNEKLIDKWSGHKCKSIFKYMVGHRDQPIHREILMDLFWRDTTPDAARRNLYQAIYALRQALQNGDPDFPYILCEESRYYLNPDLEIWVDSETFHAHYLTGQQLESQERLPEAIREYELADALYEGEFLAEDIYEEWPVVVREDLKNAHLDILSRLSQYYYASEQYAMCIAYCLKILQGDSCREDGHRRLMLAYLRQGQRHLALRQYHHCVEVLQEELDVAPMPVTVELYNQIRNSAVQF